MVGHLIVRKGMTIGIIMLFVGTSIVPSIMSSEEPNSTVESEHNNLQSENMHKQTLSASMFFTENNGQFPEEVLFQTSTNGAMLYLCKNKIVSVFTKKVEDETIEGKTLDKSSFDRNAPQIEVVAVVTRFVEANEKVQVRGGGILPNRNNYFLGNNPARWYTDVHNYQTVTYQNMYEGIDLKYFFDGGSLKYNFIVYPGADLLTAAENTARSVASA